MVTLQFGAGFDAFEVGASVGLGQGQGCEAPRLAANHSRQKALFLFFVAKHDNRHASQTVVRRDHQRRTAIAPAEFFNGNGKGQRVHRAAAVGFRHAHPHQAKLLTAFLQSGPHGFFPLVVFGCQWLDFPGDEVVHGIAPHFQFGGKGKIHGVLLCWSGMEKQKTRLAARELRLGWRGKVGRHHVFGHSHKHGLAGDAGFAVGVHSGFDDHFAGLDFFDATPGF